MANSNFVVKNGITVNGSFTANSTVVNAAAVNATSVNTATVNATTTIAVGANVTLNTTAHFVGNSSVNTNITAATILINGVNVNTMISGNAATAYSNAVANAAALYQTTAGLSANVAVLTANAATYLGNSSGTIANIASWVTGNAAAAYTNAVSNAAALYQTTAGLSANVATLTANNATNLGGAAAGAYVNATGSYTITGVHTYSANIVMGSSTITFSSGSINSTAFSTGSNTATIGTTGYFVSNGNLGIGNSAPTSKLHVQGAILASDNITAYSDARLKENVETIQNALNTVKQIRGVRYNQTENGKLNIGVIAQELQPYVPEVVQENGEYLSVAYGNLVGLLIEAIKELSAEVDQLKNNQCNCGCKS